MQKKMQSNTQIIVHNAYQNTMQNAKIKLATKNVSLILLLQSKKEQKQHRKKTQRQRNMHKKSLHDRSMYHVRKSAWCGLQGQTNLANDAWQQKNPRNQNFFKTKK